MNTRNAEVEAFAIHLRQLIEFFWIEKPQTEARRKAFAADFFAGPLVATQAGATGSSRP